MVTCRGWALPSIKKIGGQCPLYIYRRLNVYEPQVSHPGDEKSPLSPFFKGGF
jgi:hypothetical protein